MEDLYYLLQEKILHTHKDAKLLLEQFFYKWSSDFDKHEFFILAHYTQVMHLLEIALSYLDPSTTTRTLFLWQNQVLSLCLDYCNVILSPRYVALCRDPISIIRASNQRVISIWDDYSASANRESTLPGTTETGP